MTTEYEDKFHVLSKFGSKYATTNCPVSAGATCEAYTGIFPESAPFSVTKESAKDQRRAAAEWQEKKTEEKLLEEKYSSSIFHYNGKDKIIVHASGGSYGIRDSTSGPAVIEIKDSDDKVRWFKILEAVKKVEEE